MTPEKAYVIYHYIKKYVNLEKEVAQDSGVPEENVIFQSFNDTLTIKVQATKADLVRI